MMLFPLRRETTKVCVLTSVDLAVSHLGRQTPPTLTLVGATSWPKWVKLMGSWGSRSTVKHWTFVRTFEK